MANYVYKESKITTKKIAGIYDADSHTIIADGIEHNILEELSDFNGAPVDFSIRIKQETDLLDE